MGNEFIGNAEGFTEDKPETTNTPKHTNITTPRTSPAQLSLVNSYLDLKERPGDPGIDGYPDDFPILEEHDVYGSRMTAYLWDKLYNAPKVRYDGEHGENGHKCLWCLPEWVYTHVCLDCLGQAHLCRLVECKHNPRQISAEEYQKRYNEAEKRAKEVYKGIKDGSIEDPGEAV